jgi:PLP dependent protein
VSVKENLAAVRRRIQSVGGDPAKIVIVAVTKGFGPEACREALGAGLETLGENRVQEALAKMEVVEGADWHLIGHLQTNKARLAAGRFALIQSIDSTRVAEALAAIDSSQAVLVELNVAREAHKTGAPPESAQELLRAVGEMLDLRGLMGMGPFEGDPAPAFTELGAIRDEAQQRLGRSLPILSMGMSADFEQAVAAGSTMLRLGTALFGQRPQRR